MQFNSTQHAGHDARYSHPVPGSTLGSTRPVRLLQLEDSAADAELIQERLHGAGLTSEVTQVSNRSGFEAALNEGSYHLILCDLNLPGYDGLSALTVARERQPDVPVIIISGALGEEQAVKCLHMGATDYLSKERLERLPNAVWRAITTAEEQRLHRQAELELRASEERFRLLAQHSRDVFWFVGVNPERVIYVSPAIELIWGVAAPHLYDDPGRWWSAIDPADQQRVRAAWQACVDGLSPRFEEEFRVIHPDGSARLVINAGAIFLDDATGNAHMSGLVRDITERTLLQQELRQSHKMDGIGQLAGGIAHDFNNLLTVIQGNSDLALDGLDPRSTTYADIHEIKHAATSAAALTKQLLAFSRRQMLQPRPIELREIMRGLESMLSRLIGDNIELVLELDQNSGFVLADYGQIEQVIINLALNARDAMPDGGRITISTSTVPQSAKIGAQLASPSGICESLSITDTGTGMDKATRDRIFEPFFTTKPHGRGAGLGLSTVHGIVTQSGGELHVTSAPGTGTTITIYFPQLSTGRTSVAEAPTPQRGVTGSETILIVEDQPSLRDLLRRILEQQGYCVLEAHDGEEAVRTAEAAAKPIHLVITDVVMPGLSARTMTVRVREAWPDARVLFMSAYASDDAILWDLADYKVDFLQKPFLPYDLAEKVREVLERR
jgi:PAS domain S-box-containing protein